MNSSNFGFKSGVDKAVACQCRFFGELRGHNYSGEGLAAAACRLG